MNAKLTALTRGLLGIPLGIAIGFIITLIISGIYGNGEYLSARPELIAEMGSEINAVLLQTGLSALVGMAFAAGSVIWEMEDWSHAKQTGIYFLVTALVMLPVAWFARWTERSFKGIAIYFGTFVVVFIIIWAIQYFFWRQKIKKMNEKL